MAIKLIITPAELVWAEEAVQMAKEQFPRFCRHGATTYRWKDIPRFDDDGLEEVVISKLWLEHFELTKNVSRQHSSYGCKHFTENWAGTYVANGSLIAAAAGLGITQKTCDFGSPNTVLAIKYSSWPKGISWDINSGLASVEVG